jgi:membrane fusion protein (multidrug efflux system)
MSSSTEAGNRAGLRGEEPDVIQEINEQTKLARKRTTVFLRLGMFFLAAAVGGFFWWQWASSREETDDAYVDAHISNISAKISGNIQHVFVEDNQLVKAGQVLVDLDPSDYEVKVDQNIAALEEAQHVAEATHSKIGQSSLSAKGQTTQASGDLFSTEAQIESAQARISQAEAETRQTRSRIVQQEAQVKFDLADYDRYRLVYQDRVITKQQFDKAKTTYDIAVAQLAGMQHDLSAAQEKERQAKASLKDAQAKLTHSQGGVTSALAMGRQENIDKESYQGDLCAVKKAAADLKQSRLQLSYTKIVSPVSGRIGRKSAEVGQRIEAGQLLLAIVQENPWITANFKETQVGKMHRGMPVEIVIDTFPGRKFSGRIDSVAPASGAKFSMLPPDNATGNFTKVVQRVPVKIVFDKESLEPVKDLLAPGMSCVTTVLFKK